MRLIVDANILFSLIKEDSAASSIFKSHKPRLFAPKFALVELSKYKEELIKKSKLDSFKSILSLLNKKVVFVNESEYSDLLSDSQIKISDPKDIAYLALALKLKSPVWSNDPHLKEQSSILVLTTSEIIELFSE